MGLNFEEEINGEKATISVSRKTWAKLVSLKVRLSIIKGKRLSFDDVISELLDAYYYTKGEKSEPESAEK